MPKTFRLLIFFLLFLGVNFGLRAQETQRSCEVELIKEHKDSLGGYDLNGYHTYRIFYHSTDTNDIVSAIYGIPDTNFYFLSANPVWQHKKMGSYVPSTISSNPLMLERFPATAYDSWFTLGRAHQDELGSFQVLSATNSAKVFELFEGKGGKVVSDDVVLYSLPEEPNAKVGGDGKLLIGQITARGDFNGGFGVLVFKGGQNTQTEKYAMRYSNKKVAHYGCTDSKAENYDPKANANDMSCKYKCKLAIDSIAVQPDYCGNRKGELEIFAHGQQGSIAFGANGKTYANGRFTNLANKHYHVMVKDGAGCIVKDSIVLSSPPPLSIVMQGQRKPSAGKENGKIEVRVEGGNRPISVQWTANEQNLKKGKQLSGVGAGKYKVIVSDNEGCEVKRNFILQERE